jgi:hypothetical protein
MNERICRLVNPIVSISPNKIAGVKPEAQVINIPCAGVECMFWENTRNDCRINTIGKDLTLLCIALQENLKPGE